ncbi:MAG: hypothetical protein IJE68_03975 [Clostridia bacterium]|nr:hypothetical protein [Clostridia bacterium]
MRAGASGLALKVNPHNLRVGIIKDWDSHWNFDSHIPITFPESEKSSTPCVVGKVKDWNTRGDNGMKNVPRKKPHHK